MKQCRTCLDREYKDDLVCCQCNHLSFAFRELLKGFPLIGKYISDYECKGYEMDKTLTGFPMDSPVNCRCSIIFPVEGADDK